MRKVILSNKFEIDLSYFKIQDVDENNWFSDNFFTKISFPFEIDLTDDLDVAFDFISCYNASFQTYFLVKYVHNDKISDAILEIEQMQEKLSCILTFGYDQLPNFDKKLSELPFEKIVLPEGTSIYEYANTIIDKTYPEVNFNFPQVHTDSIATDNDIWAFFQKVINLRENDLFVENSVNYDDVITYNRNIMQPLPFILHVLKVGLADVGLKLEGPILEDELIKKATLFAAVEYYYTNKLKEYEYKEDVRNYISAVPYFFNLLNNIRATYYRKETVVGFGQYRVIGSFFVFQMNDQSTYGRIKYNGVTIFEQILPPTPFDEPLYYYNMVFDVVINAETLNDNVLEFEMYDREIVEYLPDYVRQISFQYNINPMFIYDSNAEPITEIMNLNEIDLKKAVPDITFGDAVKVIKNWFNYDLIVTDKIAVMYPIESQINTENAIDLREFEVKYPIRKNYQGISFLLKFQDVENKDFTFLPVFHNTNGYVNSNFNTDDKTITIEVNALPLPQFTRNGITTAYNFENNPSKVYIVPYTGLYNENNLSLPIDEYLIPNIHLYYWLKWFLFRINTQGFQWVFKAFHKKISDLNSKSKVFAYNNYHIIKSINRTELKPDLFEVDIETEVLK